MVTVITVHGTNAGDESDVGEQWWQVDSDFHRALNDRIHEQLDFAPFHWDGENSEISRRRAARKLFGVLMSAEKRGRPYFLIGHSHGGSIVKYALTLAAKKKCDLPNLAFWQTVGAPFLRVHPKANFFAAHSAIGYALLSFLILFALLGVSVLQGADSFLANFITGPVLKVPPDVRPSFNQMLSSTFGWIALAALPAIAISAAIYDFFFYRSRNRFVYDLTTTQSDIFRASRHRVFWHRHDEAISAIKAGLEAQLQIAPRTVFTPAVRLAVITIAPLASLLIAISIVIALAYIPNISQYQEGFALLTLPEAIEAARGTQTNLTLLYQFLFLWPVLGIILFTSSLVGMDRTQKWTIGSGAKNLVDRSITSQMRARATGLDDPSQTVIDVAATPFENWSNPPIPGDVEDAITRYSTPRMSDLIDRLRSVFGYDSVLHNGFAFASVTDTLSWKELIHTTYFDVDEMISLIAFSLCSSGRVSLAAEQNLQKLTAWHEETQSQSATANAAKNQRLEPAPVQRVLQAIARAVPAVIFAAAIYLTSPHITVAGWDGFDLNETFDELAEKLTGPITPPPEPTPLERFTSYVQNINYDQLLFLTFEVLLLITLINLSQKTSVPGSQRHSLFHRWIGREFNTLMLFWVAAAFFVAGLSPVARELFGAIAINAPFYALLAVLLGERRSKALWNKGAERPFLAIAILIALLAAITAKSWIVMAPALAIIGFSLTQFRKEILGALTIAAAIASVALPVYIWADYPEINAVALVQTVVLQVVGLGVLLILDIFERRREI